MKKMLMFCMAYMLAFNANAQIQTPDQCSTPNYVWCTTESGIHCSVLVSENTKALQYIVAPRGATVPTAAGEIADISNGFAGFDLTELDPGVVYTIYVLANTKIVCQFTVQYDVAQGY